MNTSDPNYKNALITGRGLTNGEITLDDFTNSQISVNGRRIYDFPGQTAKTLMAFWAGAPVADKMELEKELTETNSFAHKMQRAQEENPGKAVIGIGGQIIIGEREII